MRALRDQHERREYERALELKRERAKREADLQEAKIKCGPLPFVSRAASFAWSLLCLFSRLVHADCGMTD